jgi:hypothetical protein
LAMETAPLEAGGQNPSTEIQMPKLERQTGGRC